MNITIESTHVIYGTDKNNEQVRVGTIETARKGSTLAEPGQLIGRCDDITAVFVGDANDIEGIARKMYEAHPDTV